MTKDLKPNPDWAKLPLFDRKGWKRLGNTPAVAKEHYLQVRDEDFERAAETPIAVNECAQNPAQSRAGKDRNEQKPVEEPLSADRVFPVDTADYELPQVLTGQALGDEGNRTLIPAMRPPCAPVTPRPRDGILSLLYRLPVRNQAMFLRIAISRS